MTIGLIAGGAALFRLRGSEEWARWTGRGATSIRLIWAAYLSLCAWWVGDLDWWIALALFPAFWLGAILPWWKSLDMGRRDGTFWRDFTLHTARGVLWTAPASAVLFGSPTSSIWLLCAGLACGVVYAVSWALRTKNQVEAAEWMFGLLIASALLLPFVK